MASPGLASPLGWPDTLRSRVPLPPLWIGVLVATLAFCSYAAGSNAEGVWQGLRDAETGVFFYQTIFGRMALIVSVLLGYVLVVSVHVVRGGLRDLERLAPWLDLDEAGRAEARRSVEQVDARRARWAGAVSLPVGPIMIGVTSTPGWAVFAPGNWADFGLLWSLLVNGLVFWLTARFAYQTASQARAFGALAASLRVDFLDTRPLLVLGRRGLRLALVWVGSASLSAFLMANETFVAPMIPVLLFQAVFAATGFLGPVLGAHRRLREAKQRELAPLREAIREQRDALLGGGGERLAPLVAWEERVRGTSDWPFDTSIVVRGLLFVVLPVGSWLGGAFVERMLDAALN